MPSQSTEDLVEMFVASHAGTLAFLDAHVHIAAQEPDMPAYALDTLALFRKEVDDMFTAKIECLKLRALL